MGLFRPNFTRTMGSLVFVLIKLRSFQELIRTKKKMMEILLNDERRKTVLGHLLSAQVIAEGHNSSLCVACLTKNDSVCDLCEFAGHSNTMTNREH